MKQLCILTTLLTLTLTFSGCGGRLGLFGLRGARCGTARCVNTAVAPCGTATLGRPIVRSEAAAGVAPARCLNGQCSGPAIISASPPAIGPAESVYGLSGNADVEGVPLEGLPAAEGFESASVGFGSNEVFSHVISDRKLTAADGKLPAPNDAE